MLLQKARPPGRASAHAAALPGGQPALPPARLVRLTAALRSSALDAALAAGEDPAASGQLAARALALSAQKTRNALAEGFERLLASADGSQGRKRLRPHRDAALANAGALHELAELLRGPAPLYVRGIALARRLLADGTGPAYRADAEALGGHLSEALEQMRGGLQARA